MLTLIAVPAALVAATAFAGSAVIEQRVTHAVPERGALNPKLFLDLARSPAWLASILLSITGLALQITALHFGALALVQPILVCDLIFAVLIAAVTVRKRRPDRVILTGVLCCAAGLAGFLAIAKPHDGAASVNPHDVAPLAAALAAILAACFAVTRLSRHQARSLAIALACGILYGVDAFLFKELPLSLRYGITAWDEHWALYAVIVLAPVAFLLNENAFQAGALLAPVLAIITVADPLVSIAIAALWLHEPIAGSPAAIAAEVVSLSVMTFGIVALAHRAPQVSSGRG